ncbi:MAG: tRNA (adenosine(37)-N6)-threonylcarbamoyltransferase complex dimerization subunit type 1 TsaB [Gemmatimonadetes bacterium]|nr:tRNA (adenosine(37)-N6)-threonylcarbamoyltransferase complex dimerization subunit type 1 TsaB [Gemmatimonadota bacterium]
MLTLGLETSGPLGSVALGRGEDLIAESAISARATHSETILPEVDRMLRRASLEVRDVERIVVGAGPGSFTGVRIAASLAKGWCRARRIPLCAFSSLRAVVASSGADRVCALFDARRGEVYAEAYEEGPLAEPALGPWAGPLDTLLERLRPVPAWRFSGDGAIAYHEAITAAGGSVLPPHLAVPRASSLLWLAQRDPGGEVDDIAAWEPRYVRASGAEREAVRVG